ncbi:MAG: FKBP-type peptidyl-prolyl cis-trans isomerase [Deltaproteobacteria bacterium]|nr:FKBP-type peptidyl-prolyl cis-trans isomerase [Deltaproteobacteria bacterium]
MRKILFSLLTAVWFLTGSSVFAADPTTDDQKTMYALGVAMSQSLGVFNLSEAELEMVKNGLTDGVLKKPQKVNVQEFMPKLQQLQQTRFAAASEAEKKAGAEFLTKAAAEKGAVKTNSGLVYSTVKEGTGASPKATDTVKVHYHGTLTDGSVFDSSVDRKQPATFPLNGVIPCWTEGVQKMKVGEKARLVCPSAIAYGDRGAPPRIKPGATLVFEVELLGIETPAASESKKIEIPTGEGKK